MSAGATGTGVEVPSPAASLGGVAVAASTARRTPRTAAAPVASPDSGEGVLQRGRGGPVERVAGGGRAEVVERLAVPAFADEGQSECGAVAGRPGRAFAAASNAVTSPVRLPSPDHARHLSSAVSAAPSAAGSPGLS